MTTMDLVSGLLQCLAMPVTLSAWWLLPLVPIILLIGEQLVWRVRVLARFHIPVPVIGGLFASVALLVLQRSGLLNIQFSDEVSALWYTWIVTPEPLWLDAPTKKLSLPFMTAFFTCIGLTASLGVVRRGSLQLVGFWLLATGFAMFQNVIGLTGAHLMGESPLLGLLAGSVSMTGGHGTSLGFASEFTKLGLERASEFGAAAATIGLVAGGIIGGPVARLLLKRHGLQGPLDSGRPHAPKATDPGPQPPEASFFARVRWLARGGRRVFWHVLVLLVLIKLGSWLSWGIQGLGMTFPPQMGAMLLGVIVRNVMDVWFPGKLSPEVIDRMGEVSLAIFLAIALSTLRLGELAAAAMPLIILVGCQVVAIGLFAYFITFRMMGRDYEAAVMSAGHCGFGLGATPNAVANMSAVTARHGPAPRAYIVVPTTGAILIDFSNVMGISIFLNFVI